MKRLVLVLLLIPSLSHGIYLCYREGRTTPRVREICRDYEIPIVINELSATVPVQGPPGPSGAPGPGFRLEDCFILPSYNATRIGDACNVGDLDMFCIEGKEFLSNGAIKILSCHVIPSLPAQGNRFATCCPMFPIEEETE